MFHSQKPLQIKFFFLLLLLVGALTFFILAPYLLTLAVAAAFAVVLQPLYKALHRMFKERFDAGASILTIIIAVIVILGPLSLIVAQIVDQAGSLYTQLSSGGSGALFDLLAEIEAWIGGYIPQYQLDVTQYVSQAAGLITNSIGSIFAGTFQTGVHLILGFVALYYFLKDGAWFIQTAITLSPLSDVNDEIIFKKMHLSISSIIKGNLLIALIQGTVSGIGMAIFGVPNATLWGSLAGFSALIPSLGTSLVLLPTVVYLYFTNGVFSAIGMLIWAALAVGSIDNFLGPILIGRGVHIHPLWILFAVIGGISLFGPLGFIVGPLVISLFYALLDIYRELFIEEKGRL